MDENFEIIQEFIVEAAEMIDGAEQDLLVLEEGSEGTREAIESLFRRFHTIKGTAGFLNFGFLEKATHAGETVLDGVRTGEITPTPEIVSVLLELCDLNKELLTYIAEHGREPDECVAAGVIADKLNAMAQDDSLDPSATAETPANEASSSEPKSAEEKAVIESDMEQEFWKIVEAREVESEGAQSTDSSEAESVAETSAYDAAESHPPTTDFEYEANGEIASEGEAGHVEDLDAAMDESFWDKVREMDEAELAPAEPGTARSWLEVEEAESPVPYACEARVTADQEQQHTDEALASITAAPAAGTSEEKVSSIEVEVSSMSTDSVVKESLEETVSPSKKQVSSPTAEGLPEEAAAAAGSSVSREGAPVAGGEGDPLGAKSQITESSIRVDVSLLDSLMNLVSELVLTRNQIIQFTKNQTDSAILGAAQRLNLITSELQENVMKTRMQPIANVWGKFPRVVRDIAKSCGKQVRLEMVGKDTDLDKTIIEAIKDPLTHIIRNSVDHGIEMPDVRLAAGKPAEGTIILRAFHEGGYVILEIEDDGGGLRTDRIKQKAIDRGLVSAEKAARMSEQEIHRFIFAAGFSTAEQVTKLSGRGVGMDVVKSNIERIGGQIDIISRQGEGTNLKIKIPLTLAIVPTLIVSTASERFAIPQVSLVELVRVQGEHIRTHIVDVDGKKFYRLRGNLLPLVYLGKELCLCDTDEGEITEDSKVNIVVVKTDNQLFGLVVEAVHDTEEIVVKPLSKQLQNIEALSGATIMGDGHVALIIDVVGLAKKAGVLAGYEENEQVKLDQHKTTVESAQPSGETVLIVEASADVRGAIPLELVHRLEEFGATNLEMAGGVPVIQYRGGILPLIDLQRFFTGVPLSEGDVRKVVVYDEGERRVGFMVRRIVDIVQTPIDTYGSTKRKGTKGSAVIQKRVTDLIDLPVILSQTNIDGAPAQ